MIDYHLHTVRCGHAEGTLEQYWREAVCKGLKEIGFADHFPLDVLNFEPPEKVTMEGWELPQYIGEVLQLSLKNGSPNVKLGIEVDFLPGLEKAIYEELSHYPFDYVIGSVHFLEDWDFTNPACAGAYEKCTAEEILTLYEKYYILIEKLAEAELCDIVGHLDVIKKFGYRPPGGTAHLIERVTDLLREADLCIELNTAGLYTSASEVYPSKEILESCFRRGIPVTLGSDAHRPEDVGRDLEMALDLLREIGYREIAVFKDRKRGSLKI
ncbi:histidinol-phosphatase HisJ family protein [Candidatus Contubernalis alkaliaceticus]|uniref:histidinol-phosphatase HisJ family protein n=1 Tax=Candidatus Contubernalis alkaliaceticus TaxID=338645 RepID=UPI001F4C06A5|nr:histidinol-phosphatase HisJ family protein [Candidatus Contubernalis alkalaceticus]UNC92899.1 histidinol-phosphatase HisJ family protein [Candidatus Contubernalis alkalaceticus]